MLRKTFSGLILIILLTGILTSTINIQPVKASGTIYIRSDGSIDPPTANITTTDNVTYTFTGNINEQIVVERNNITINGADYTLYYYGGKGIDLHYRSNVTIKNTNIKNFQYGVYLYSSSNNTVSGNNITNNTFGVYLGYSSNNNMVSGNNITNNSNGILVEKCNVTRIIENTLTKNGDSIVIIFCEEVITSRNLITLSSGYGIVSYGSNFNIIQGNTISNNCFGIGSGYSDYCTIYHNNFIGNDKQAYIEFPSFNAWDAGYPSGGNYWSDYTGVDADGDGIGDTPYVIDANNTDRYPLMNPYWLPGDVNHDLKIDIYDVVTCTKDYRKEYTP